MTSVFQGIQHLISTIPQTQIQICCEYCGNTSGKQDSRGGCISCGGYSKPPELITKSFEDMWAGSSGSSYSYKLVMDGIITPEEYRKSLPSWWHNDWSENG